MRVLALALLVGCYDPQIDDCQFRCGPGGDCPDGTSCTNGVCRTSGGQCMVSDPCPAGTPASPNSSCTVRFALAGNRCGVLCGGNNNGNQKGWLEARSLCNTNNWQLGVLTTTEQLEAVPVDDDYWVGAGRQPAAAWRWEGGAPVSTELWSNGEPFIGMGSDCARLDANRHRLSNPPCGDDELYICTFPRF